MVHSRYLQTGQSKRNFASKSKRKAVIACRERPLFYAGPQNQAPDFPTHCQIDFSTSTQVSACCIENDHLIRMDYHDF